MVDVVKHSLTSVFAKMWKPIRVLLPGSWGFLLWWMLHWHPVCHNYLSWYIYQQWFGKSRLSETNFRVAPQISSIPLMPLQVTPRSLSGNQTTTTWCKQWNHYRYLQRDKSQHPFLWFFRRKIDPSRYHFLSAFVCPIRLQENRDTAKTFFTYSYFFTSLPSSPIKTNTYDPFFVLRIVAWIHVFVFDGAIRHQKAGPELM